jgi:hypothetical protein
MTKPVAFSEDGARRVIAATKAYEAGNRDMPGIKFRDVSDDERDPVRLGKTSAAWNKGAIATIDIWENGEPPNETQTSGATLTGCVNKFVNVAAGKWVILARCQNGSYYLIAAECS